jgi:hypothetical protein
MTYLGPIGPIVPIVPLVPVVPVLPVVPIVPVIHNPLFVPVFGSPDYQNFSFFLPFIEDLLYD